MALYGGSDEELPESDSQDESETWSTAWDDHVSVAADNLSKNAPRGQRSTTTNKTTLAKKLNKDDQSTDRNLSNSANIEGTSTVMSKPETWKAEAEVVSRMQLNDNKAGMEGLDKEKINAIIYEASKGSKYYENEVKKEEQVNRRLAEQKHRLDSLTAQQLEEGRRAADELLAELELTRDLSRTIVHVDMDMFYAAVEMRDDPGLKTKPMAVGGNSMLSTSNYVARKFGVRAAMPGFIARKLCPELIIVPENFAKYREVSQQVRGILAQYDPHFSPMSLDEAYLDFTQHLRERAGLGEEERTFAEVVEDVACCACRVGQQKVDSAADQGETHGSTAQCSACAKPVSSTDRMGVFGTGVEEAVREMRHRIHLTTRLTASAGIAPNTMIAKVCSDKNKPNGQYRVQPTRESVLAFIQHLPIRKVSGIGKVSEKMLSGVGVVTCPQLHSERATLYHLYSPISFHYFMRICRGLGSTRVERDSERKSMSTERTFTELSKPQELYDMCAKLSQALAEDMHGEQLVGKTVTLKIKTVAFEVKTRAHTLHSVTQSHEQIYEAARALLKTEIQACAPKPLRLRLMGVRMSNLGPVSELGKQRQNTITSFLSKSASKPVQKPTEPEASSIGQELDRPATSSSVAGEGEIRPGHDELLDSVNSYQSRTDTLSYIAEENGANLHNYKGTQIGLDRVCEPVTCPVCGRAIKTTRMELIHEHINFCLEKGSNVNFENISVENENLTKMADAPVSNMANNPMSDISDEAMSKRADSPISKFTGKAMSKMTDASVSKYAEKALSNMADGPASHAEAQTVENSADGAVTGQISVNEVYFSGDFHTSKSDEPSKETCDLKVSENVDCDKKVNSSSDKKQNRVETVDSTINVNNPSVHNKNLKKTAESNSDPSDHNKNVKKTVESNSDNSKTCFDKYKYHTSSRFGITFIPLFTASPSKEHGHSNIANEFDSPSKGSQTPLNQDLRIKDSRIALNRGLSDEDEFVCERSAHSGNNIKQHVHNCSPDQTCATTKSPLKSSPKGKTQRHTYFNQTKSNELKERSHSNENMLQGGALDKDLKPRHSMIKIQNSLPKKEISVEVQNENKDSGQGSAENKVVASSADTTLNLNAPSSSMLTAGDNQALHTQMRPSTVDRNCFEPLNETEQVISRPYFQKVSDNENISAADFSTLSESPQLGNSGNAVPLPDYSNVECLRQNNKNVARSDGVPHAKAGLDYSQSAKSNEASWKVQPKFISPYVDSEAVANEEQIKSPNRSVSKTNMLSKEQSIDKRSKLGYALGASPKTSPSTSVSTSSKTNVDPVSESGSIPDQASPSVKSMFTCPVCGMKVSATLTFFNKHLDSCLSKQTIKDMVGHSNDQIARSPVTANKKNASGSKLKNPKDAKRRRIDSGQKSMASFLTSSK